MINEKELEIANTSYTNKDFGAIYTEVLDIARKLSALWSPQSSNESDPGVVLLKLLAFLGDKLNYNVDKNTLENFMPSATQDSSMRKLCDMMGYYINYYTSAETDISFSYKGNLLNYDTGDTNKKFMTFEKFKTVISNEDSSLQYVLWDDLVLDTTQRTNTARCIEGFLSTLNVGDSDKITLDNIDSQNRIYFGESQVAQNGILIKNYGESDDTTTFWTRVSNLNTQDPGSKCFKFGYDSKRQLPYIEFPVDIASLIGDGLSIRYIVTSGYYGNVGVGNLNKLVSPTSVDVHKTGVTEPVATLSFTDESGNSALVIKNNSAALNGSDPEDIDTAYNNFKKTIGTFTTLVTCRDYANYIYNYLVTSNGNPLVSNVQTADRRLDLNHSKNILTYGSYGQYLTNTSEDYSKLFIYALHGINNPSNESEFKDSFNLFTDITPITQSLEYGDSPAIISYEYAKGSEDDIGLIKILYSLDVKITTTYKVNAAEQLDIKKNVIDALRRTFYSRNIDYGYEIPYDTIYQTIMNSDSRIKAISLKEPVLDSQYINGNNTVLTNKYGTAANDYKDSAYLKVLAKNVLAGRVPLFNYDNRFSYEFGMGKYSHDGSVVGPVLSNVETFTSETDITLTTSDYPVQANELIQMLGPKLVNETEFTTYVNYWCDFDLLADTDKLLGDNEHLLLVYTDSSQNQIEVLLQGGDIVRSNFDLDSSKFSDPTITKKIKKLKTPNIISVLGTDEVGCLGIGTNESIWQRSIVRHTFDSTVKVAWLVNDLVEKNTIWDKFQLLPRGNDDPYVYEFILGDTDYFIYSLDSESSYEIFGSGTSLRLESDSALIINNFFPGTCNIPNLDDLYEFGIETIGDILKSITFTSGVKFIIQANEILTLAEGDVAKIDGDSGTCDVSNIWQEFDYTLAYKLLGAESSGYEYLNPPELGEGLFNGWRIRSRLDLVSGPNKTQILKPNQSITFKKNNGVTVYTISGGDTPGGRIRTNIALDLPGGTDVQLKLVDPTSIIGDVTYPVSVLVFADDDNKAENFPRSDGYYSREISVAGLSDFTTGYSMLIPTDLTNEKTILMLNVSFLDTLVAGTAGITITGRNASNQTVTLKNYGDGSTVSYIDCDVGTKLFILEIPSNCVKLQITPTVPAAGDVIGALKLGVINPTDGFNKRFKLAEIEAANSIQSGKLTTALKSIISDIDDTNIFYYNASLDRSEEIEEEDLSSPFAFFDSNNVASRFALGYIDIDNSTIEITRSSKV